MMALKENDIRMLKFRLFPMSSFLFFAFGKSKKIHWGAYEKILLFLGGKGANEKSNRTSNFFGSQEWP